LNFRNATAADIDAIVVLVESAYRGDSSRQGWTTEADLLDGQRTNTADVARVIAHQHSRVLLLTRSSGELCACAHIERQNEVCYFGMFSVNPAEQGGGIGRMMLAEAERIARDEWQCREMQMTVISIRDELIAWYQRRGYQRTGRFKPFPYDDARFGLPKRDDLRFEILSKQLFAIWNSTV
jgi:ribosomal protein S18 acetylase RimI-like enzyme